jgi:universal stress protein E
MTQIRRILLASDLMERSQIALARAVQLKRATASGLTLMHVVDPGLTEELGKRRQVAAMATMEAHLADLSADKLRRMVLKASVGDPVAVIVAEAESADADLVMLGEPGQHRLKELFAGTTAERVIRHSRRPVLVVKVPSDQPYQRVVTAFDRSEAAGRALATALALAPRAEFRLVYASPGSEDGRGEEEAAHTQVLLADAAEQVMRRSLYPHARLAVEVGQGAPAQTITSALAALDADLLAMGTHSSGRLQAAVFGSVAQQLLAASPCDVVVTRPHWRE